MGAFAQMTKKDLAEPHITDLIKELEEKAVRSIAIGVLDHKKWRKPARKIYLQILKEVYKLK